MRATFFCSLISLVLVHHVYCSVISQIDDILKSGINDRVYPAVVAMAGRKSHNFGSNDVEIIYSGAFGNYQYLSDNANAPNVTLDNLFDMASVTKVVSTTPAVALLYQRGYLSLSDKIGEILDEPTYSSTGGKENVTVLNCLLHNAGYLPDPTPNFWEDSFGCPQGYGMIENFACLDMEYSNVMNQILVTPPGVKMVYSDLSFITLQMVVGRIAFKNNLVAASSLRPICTDALASNPSSKVITYVCYYDAFIRKEVYQEDKSWLKHMGFLPPSSLSSLAIPTTVVGDSLRQGNVSDGNCYMMGGICGHAGIFTDMHDMSRLAERYLVLASASSEASIDPFPGWLNVTTMKLFAKEYNATQSSRALGFTTNDPSVSTTAFFYLFLF
jgi:CubicO group peptidase (beta-lactamase class C family)